jgi:hypothetical protein
MATEVRTQRLVVEDPGGRELITAGPFNTGRGHRLALYGPNGEMIDLYMNEDQRRPFMGCSMWAKGSLVGELGSNYNDAEEHVAELYLDPR